MPDETPLRTVWETCAEAYSPPLTLDTLRRANEQLRSYTFIEYSNGDVWESASHLFDDFSSPPVPHSQGSRKGAIQIKEHSDERQFWEDMLDQKFITWKECLAGMRACRKREKLYLNAERSYRCVPGKRQ